MEYMPSNDGKSCEKSPIDKCLEPLNVKLLDGSRKHLCKTCQPGYEVSKDGTKCSFLWFPIHSCVVYGSIRVDRKQGAQTYCKVCEKDYYPVFKVEKGKVSTSCLYASGEGAE